MKEFEYTVLIIDDDPLNITALTHLLSDEFNVIAERSGAKSVTVAREAKPDVILLDVVMPDMNGFEVIASLKKDENTRDIPVIFVTGLNNTRDEEQGLILGAVDYINKPFSSYIVKLRIKNQLLISTQLKTMHELSTTDQLTGLVVRKPFHSILDNEWRKVSLSGDPISLTIFCIDNFSQYNEQHGYDKGDEALRYVSQMIARSVPWAGDYLVRWGGDEFAILFPGTPIDEVKEISDNIRAAVASGNHEGTITLSGGLHSHKPTTRDMYTVNEFILDTATALAHAKKTGRNKISIFSEI